MQSNFYSGLRFMEEPDAAALSAKEGRRVGIGAEIN